MEKLGYRSVTGYFCGESKYNPDLYGWAGHTEDGKDGQGINGKIIHSIDKIYIMWRAIHLLPHHGLDGGEGVKENMLKYDCAVTGNGAIRDDDEWI